MNNAQVTNENTDTWIAGSTTELPTESPDINFPVVAQNSADIRLNMVTNISESNFSLSNFWCLDGGANGHVCGNAKLLSNIRSCAPQPIITQDHREHTVNQCGDMT